jgi:prepilin-type N-terminal cleavage/methylation domain-containing protein
LRVSRPKSPWTAARSRLKYDILAPAFFKYGYQRAAMRRRTRTTRGFTLVEVAIVLVVIGLLMGSILKGQELLTSARVRELIAQQDGVKAAFFGFQERYGSLPGDYAQATSYINNTTQNGNGNGRIEEGGTPNESIVAWEHLSGSSFLTGSYRYAPVQSPTSSQLNRYGAFQQIAYDGIYGAGTPASPVTLRHNIKTGAQIPVEIDRKIDDGRPNAGSFQFSRYAAGASVPPTDGSMTVPSCTTALTADAVWNTAIGSPNCGAASLL